MIKTQEWGIPLSSSFIVNFHKFTPCSNALPVDVWHTLKTKPGAFIFTQPSGLFLLGRTPRKKKRKEPYDRGARGFYWVFCPVTYLS